MSRIVGSATIRFALEAAVLFVALAVGRAYVLGKGWEAQTFLWAGIVAVGLAGANAWGRKRGWNL